MKVRGNKSQHYGKELFSPTVQQDTNKIYGRFTHTVYSKFTSLCTKESLKVFGDFLWGFLSPLCISRERFGKKFGQSKCAVWYRVEVPYRVWTWRNVILPSRSQTHSKTASRQASQTEVNLTVIKLTYVNLDSNCDNQLTNMCFGAVQKWGTLYRSWSFKALIEGFLAILWRFMNVISHGFASKPQKPRRKLM